MLVFGGICVAFFLGVIALSASGDSLLSFARMGRNQDVEDIASLTGRVPIWEEVVQDIGDHPILGYGYGGFWSPARVAYYATIHDWAFDHAHSAYLETMVNIGVIGLAIGLSIVALSLRGAIHSFADSRDPGFRFIAGVLTFAVFHGVLDTNFVRVGFACTTMLIGMAIVAFHAASPSSPEAAR